jgi:excisionase family DNA binding protein
MQAPQKMVVSGGPLSTGAAARVAGVHPTTVLRAIQRGELPAHRLGRRGHHRIDREELERWLQPTTRGEKPCAF